MRSTLPLRLNPEHLLVVLRDWILLTLAMRRAIASNTTSFDRAMPTIPSGMANAGSILTCSMGLASRITGSNLTRVPTPTRKAYATIHFASPFGTAIFVADSFNFMWEDVDESDWILEMIGFSEFSGFFEVQRRRWLEEVGTTLGTSAKGRGPREERARERKRREKKTKISFEGWQPGTPSLLLFLDRPRRTLEELNEIPWPIGLIRSSLSPSTYGGGSQQHEY